MRLLTAGESHGPGVIAVLDGVPAGLAVSSADIDVDLRRRITSLHGEFLLFALTHNALRARSLGASFANGVMRRTASPLVRSRAQMPSTAPSTRSTASMIALFE